MQSQCRNSPRSCLDIARTQKIPLLNDYYLMYDTNTCHQAFPRYFIVYCDFTSQPGYAWTLIESFSRAKSLDSNINAAFSYDIFVNNLNPRNHWSYYRMSRTQMLYIYHRYGNISNQPLWRATCNFESLSHPFSSSPPDVVYSSFSRLNILDFYGQTCSILDYVSVRGYTRWSSLYYVEAHTGQHFRLHIESVHQLCGYIIPSHNSYDHYFGDYNIYYHPRFSCTRSGSSTTNWWIGAKIL